MSIDADQLQNLLLNIVDCSIADRRANYIKLGATYNEDTGLYSLNGIDDLTEEDMDLIYTTASVPFVNGALSFYRGRTNFPTCNLSGYTPIVANGSFSQLYNAESIILQSTPITYSEKIIYFSQNGAQRCIINNPKLHSVYGIMRLDKLSGQDFNGAKMFENCPLLKRVRIILKGGDLYFNTNLIDNAINGDTEIKVYVADEVYSKLTDTENTEWNALYTVANNKKNNFYNINYE